MTIQELAEREYPKHYAYHKDIFEGERAAFIKGLESALEFAEYIGTLTICWTGIDWWDTRNDNKYCDTTEELLNKFLTEKYGSNDNGNTI